jgi:hypothetical protein
MRKLKRAGPGGHDNRDKRKCYYSAHLGGRIVKDRTGHTSTSPAGREPAPGLTRTWMLGDA